jgi:outer membrane translocation and assembly module TamA
LSVPLNNLESRLRFTLGYQLQDQKALSPLRNGLFNGVAVFQGRRDNAFATLAFSDSLKYPWSVSHEEGRNLSVTAKYYGPETGSDLSSREYLADYEEFFHLPGGLTSHHVLVARLSGGIADGDLTPQQAFQLGGLRSFLNPFALRGYPERSETGKYVATGTLEHRFPAWYILRGFGSKPIFLDRLHGATFVDAGQVWDDNRSFRSDRIKVGAGLEARLDMTIGYWARLTPAIGYAHGFNQGGEDRLYFTIYVDL